MDVFSYELGKKAGGGGGGGTDNYNNLSNKPSINSVTLSGNKTLSDLGIEIIQYSTMPTASSDYVGKIVQYTGESVSNSYQNGYFYIGVTDGETIPTYSWQSINVQDISTLVSKSSFVYDSQTETLTITIS